ncbi:ferrous iron transport protein A [Candidatus Woesearchaeota archaeon]|nr:ferrous iron transport protein A [Candidatus Woesearchaeota archaeon]
MSTWKSDTLIPLTDLRAGKSAEVITINCGHQLIKRLCDLGLLEGSTIKVSKNDSGPLIIEILDTRLAIGRGQANKIYVRELE